MMNSNVRIPPPVGLRPKKFWWAKAKTDRLSEIMHAMLRYAQASIPVPVEWVREAFSLTADLVFKSDDDTEADDCLSEKSK